MNRTTSGETMLKLQQDLSKLGAKDILVSDLLWQNFPPSAKKTEISSFSYRYSIHIRMDSLKRFVDTFK